MTVIIKNACDMEEEYMILACFPFSSETKRMGIVLRHKASQRIVFYLKGADPVMKQRVKPNQRLMIDEKCEQLA
jgi:phospholipid-translocating ATPase